MIEGRFMTKKYDLVWFWNQNSAQTIVKLDRCSLYGNPIHYVDSPPWNPLFILLLFPFLRGHCQCPFWVLTQKGAMYFFPSSWVAFLSIRGSSPRWCCVISSSSLWEALPFLVGSSPRRSINFLKNNILFYTVGLM